MSGCFNPDATLSDTIDSAMRDQESGNLKLAMGEWAKTAPMVERDIKNCDKVLDEYNRIKQYEKDVLARPDAKDYIKEMIEKNKEWVEGAEAAKIEQWKDDNAVMTDGSDRDPYAPAQFTAGWYYGIAEDD